MLYGLLIATALIAAGFWIHWNYTTKNVSSNTRVHWHRLIANNVYLAVLKMPGAAEWHVEISIRPSDVNTAEINVNQDKRYIMIDLMSGASLETLRQCAKDNELIDPVIELFLEGMVDPVKAAPLFPNPKDYEVYKELIFYLGASLNKA